MDIVERLEKLSEMIGASVLGGPMLIAEAQKEIASLRAGVLAEREDCARIASGMSGTDDCDYRGPTDMETGEVPCKLEKRGEVCVCAERLEVASNIADRIRSRSTTTV